MPGKYQSEEHSRRTAQLISVTRCAYAFPCTNTFISIFSFSLRRDTTVALKKNKPTIKMRLMEQLKARPLQRIQRVATHVDDGAVTWIFTCEISTRADTILEIVAAQTMRELLCAEAGYSAWVTNVVFAVTVAFRIWIWRSGLRTVSKCHKLELLLSVSQSLSLCGPKFGSQQF